MFISFVREEIDFKFNLLGTDSENFFIKAKSSGDTILVSGLFFKEIFHVLSLPEKDILLELKNLGLIVEVIRNPPEERLVSEICRSCNLHRTDSIHVATALENKADLIVTWNKRDFCKTERFVRCLSPADFS